MAPRRFWRKRNAQLKYRKVMRRQWQLQRELEKIKEMTHG
jgi:hypothetical protein